MAEILMLFIKKSYMNSHPKSTHEHNDGRAISGSNDQHGNLNKGQRTSETKLTDPAAATQKKLDKKNRHRPLL